MAVRLCTAVADDRWSILMWKLPPFQLRAYLATLLVKFHTWRHARKNSSVWKTHPWVRPSEREEGLFSGEHHCAFMDYCVFVHQQHLHGRFLCSPPAHQLLSQNWVTLMLNHSSLCSSQQKTSARWATLQNHQSKWESQMTLVHQVSTSLSFLEMLYFNMTVKYVYVLQLSHMLKRRNQKRRASSTKT